MICARTPVNWLSILLYYIIFLLCVFGILYASLEIVQLVADQEPDKPRYILEDSPIGTTPELSYFPMSTEYGPLLALTGSYRPQVKRIDELIDNYKKCKGSKCVNITALGNCSTSPYGYDKGTPCIYLRLSRILNWKPIPYTPEDALPKGVPRAVENAIKSASSPRIWIFCSGKHPKDRDHIKEDALTVSEGFDPSLFPFKKQKNYNDPIIAFQLDGSELKGTLYAVICSAYAKNMAVDKTSSEILLYFQ